MSATIFAVAVEQQGRHAIAFAEHSLGCLAPARMRHVRIHVRPEAVFGGLQRLPEAVRPLVDEAESCTIDLIDLKPYFHGSARRSGAPTAWRAACRRRRSTMKARSLSASAMVSALDIGPGIPELPAARWRCRIHERLDPHVFRAPRSAWRDRPAASTGSRSREWPSTTLRRSDGDKAALRAAFSSGDRRCRSPAASRPCRRS